MLWIFKVKVGWPKQLNFFPQLFFSKLLRIVWNAFLYHYKLLAVLSNSHKFWLNWQFTPSLKIASTCVRNFKRKGVNHQSMLALIRVATSRAPHHTCVKPPYYSALRCDVMFSTKENLYSPSFSTNFYYIRMFSNLQLIELRSCTTHTNAVFAFSSHKLLIRLNNKVTFKYIGNPVITVTLRWIILLKAYFIF